MNNNSVSLILGFDGEALRSHEMDIRELAPALISFAEMIEEADKVINNSEHKIDIKVKAFAPGSFEVVLQVIGSLREQLFSAINLMDSKPVNAMLNLVEVLGLVKSTDNKIGLLSLIKNVAGKKIKDTKKLNDSDIEITLSDNRVIKTSDKALQLFQSRKVRLSIKGMVKPLDSQGIDSITTRLLDNINDKNNRKVIISKDDVDSFNVDDDSSAEKLQESVRETYLQLVTVQMQSGKWRFSDGDTTFFASVEDEDFLEKVKDGKEQFAADDIMHVQLREKQSLNDSGDIRIDRTIIKVINHRSCEKQIPLPFEKDG